MSPFQSLLLDYLCASTSMEDLKALVGLVDMTSPEELREANLRADRYGKTIQWLMAPSPKRLKTPKISGESRKVLYEVEKVPQKPA